MPKLHDPQYNLPYNLILNLVIKFFDIKIDIKPANLIIRHKN